MGGPFSHRFDRRSDGRPFAGFSVAELVGIYNGNAVWHVHVVQMRSMKRPSRSTLTVATSWCRIQRIDGAILTCLERSPPRVHGNWSSVRQWRPIAMPTVLLGQFQQAIDLRQPQPLIVSLLLPFVVRAEPADMVHVLASYASQSARNSEVTVRPPVGRGHHTIAPRTPVRTRPVDP
jgi:hypothetical protein